MKYTIADIDKSIAVEEHCYQKGLSRIADARKLLVVAEALLPMLKGSTQEAEAQAGITEMKARLPELEEALAEIETDHAVCYDALMLLKEKVATELGAVSEEVYKAAYEHDQELINDAKRDLLVDDDVIEAEEEDVDLPTAL